MNKRDKHKGQTIARVMAKTGCSYAYAETAYAYVERTVIQVAVKLVVGMVGHKVRRDMLGQDQISRN